MIILLVIISLSILILVHELGHFLSAKFFGVRVLEFGLGFPPRLFSKRIHETVYSVNLLPFGGFVKIFGEDGENKEELMNERSFSSQPVWRRSVIVLAGILMNILLGWLILSFVFMAGSPLHLVIADAALETPAARAGLQSGDIILNAQFGIQSLKDPVKVDDFKNLVESAGENEISLKIQRGKYFVDINLRGRLNPPEGQGSLGVSLVEIGIEKSSILKSFIKGAQESFAILKLVTVGFFNFFSRLFVEPKIIETVTGPVGIFALAAQAGSLGIVYLFQLMALISLNLSVLNLIPFPALDGGRFLFLLFEKIKGSPISRKFQIIVNAIGFAFLITLMIVVTIQDISKLM